MPLANRVDPFGALFATAARGTLMGNRGGQFHDTATQTVPRRPWASKQWICCVLDFKARRRTVWTQGYTELFFLDEVTALASGHRPCFECRRAEATAFARAWGQAAGTVPRAPQMDLVLDSERRDGRTKRRHRLPADTLPDAAMVEIEGVPFAVRGDALLRWTPEGYAARRDRPAGFVEVLTPPSIVTVLRQGYRPRWHATAADPARP